MAVTLPCTAAAAATAAAFANTFGLMLQSLPGLMPRFYTPQLFLAAGAGSSAALQSSVIVMLVSLVGTLVAMAVVDSLGRRPLLLQGSMQMFVTLVSCSLPTACMEHQPGAPVNNDAGSLGESLSGGSSVPDPHTHMQTCYVWHSMPLQTSTRIVQEQCNGYDFLCCRCRAGF
jgi:hypothetical protein